jgi:hypothetical protein
MSITINGGTTVNGGVTVKAAPAIMVIHQNQIDTLEGNSPLVNGFTQVIYGTTLIVLTQEQQDYIANLSGPAENYVLFNCQWNNGSTDQYPNTAFVIFPIDFETWLWEYVVLLPLDSDVYNEYDGNWNFPVTATELIDWN